MDQYSALCIFVLGKQLISWYSARSGGKLLLVFRILAISAFGQILFGSIVWLLVSRGQSGRLLKLLLIISTFIIGSAVSGLPFSIKSMALSGFSVLLSILPWLLKFSFRGTNFTLQRLGRALLHPVGLRFVGVFPAELALDLTRYGSEPCGGSFAPGILAGKAHGVVRRPTLGS